MNDAQFKGLMQSMDRAGEERDLPPADAIWWRAQLQQRLILEERAMRPLWLVERVACAACLLGAIVLSAVAGWVKL